MCFFIVSCRLNGQSPAADSLISILEKTNDDTARVSLMIRISELNTLSSPKMALEYAMKSVAVAKGTSSHKHYLNALRTAGAACFYAGLIDEAARYGTENYEQSKLYGTKADLAYALVNLSAIRMVKNLNDSVAANHLNSAIRLLKEYSLETKSKPDSNLPTIYNNLGQYYKSTGKLEKAKAYFREGIGSSRQSSGDQAGLMRLMINYGDILLSEGAFDSAWEYFSDARNLSLRTGDKLLHSAAEFYFGAWYDQKKMPQKALSFYKYALSIAVEADAVLMISEVAQKISESYRTLGPADSALRYLDISTKYAEKSKKAEAVQEIERRELMARFRDLEAETNRKKALDQKKYIAIISVILAFLAITTTLYWRTRKNKRRLMLQKLETELEARKLQLEKDLLQAELHARDKKIANEVIYKIQKNEMISDVVNKLLAISASGKSETHRQVGIAVSDLKKALEEKVWEEFEIRFQQVNSDFYQKLREINPGLTLNERRLCAFIRLDMSTKEIAAITGQTANSIDVARTRMRRKLNLTNTQQTLSEFLSNI